MRVTILWRTDPWFSDGPKELIGVFNEWVQMEIAMVQAGATREQISELENSCCGQTQCNNTPYAFWAQDVEMNENIL